jgi:hypothetical protein
MRGFKPERAYFIPEGATERADTESTAVAFVYTSARGNFGAVMFSGKRQRPDSNYTYRTEAHRDAEIEKHFGYARSREKYQTEQREQRKAITRANSALDFTGQTYLSGASVAALCRQALKEAFPGTKFSVTSAGSINVKWTDGPSRDAVESIAKDFAGSYFDGMIDYKGSIHHELDGRRVSFGADFVFCERAMSREALEIGAQALSAKWAQQTNQAPCTFIEHENSWGGWLEIKANPDFPGACESARMHGEIDLIGPEYPDRPAHTHAAARALELWFDSARPVETQPSATLARVRVLGSDGYGNTALEAADGGETGRGYPRQQDNPEADRMRAALEEAAADLARTIEEAAEAAQQKAAPIPAECQIIDFLPHLIARADTARRIN